MREVKAFIREKRANEVMQALRAEGFKSLTVSEAEGTGKYTRKEDSPSLRFPMTHSKMSKLEIVCKKEDVESIVQVIHEHCGKNKKGEGIIYVSEVLEIYKVRTGKLSKDDIEQ